MLKDKPDISPGSSVSTGSLYVVAAPSGAGKTSLVKALVESMEGVVVSVSYTTRPRRPGERDGVNYHFVDMETFRQMIADNAFLEHAQVFGNYYGTARNNITEQLRQGVDVILEIDWQGARQVREALSGVVGVFILPPSREVLEQRLRGRGQDSREIIERRMKDAVDEMSHYHEFDYLVVNDDFDQALAELRAIILARRLRLAVQQLKLKTLLSRLVSS